MNDDEIFLRVLVGIFASLTFVYAVIARLPNPATKLIAILPIIYLFCKLPWLFSGMLARIHLINVLAWLANLKLILFCFDSGPLIAFRHDFPRFLLFAALAVYPKIKSPNSPNPNSPNSNSNKDKKNPNVPSPQPGISIPRLFVYAVIFFSFLKFYSVKEILQPPPIVIAITYSFAVYITSDTTLSLVAHLARLLCPGVELETPFVDPYLSNSLSEFWGKRWNLIVSNTLRPAVYRPIRNACLKYTDDKQTARAAATLAVFLLSGIVHEVQLYAMVFVPPTGEWLAFFLLQGVLVSIEDGLKRRTARAGIVVPRLVSVTLTLTVLYTTATWLFFPPIFRYVLDVKAHAELTKNVAWWKGILGMVTTNFNVFAKLLN